MSRSPVAAAGLTRPAIEAIFAPLAHEAGLLLAVSGGPDSTALLLMAAAWRGGPQLFAATVDHGLRAQSAEEARDVARLCEKLGVPHLTLIWQGDKPKTRLLERAREARYALLAQSARDVGASAIVTAHHLDDQAETVMFRLMRGSGLAGLAGMAARSEREGMALVRPLLGLSKAQLTSVCDAEGVGYARDPTNHDSRYARPRLRALAASLAAEGLDAPALARLARRAALVEEALSRQTAAAEARLRLIETGSCDAALLLAEPREIVQRLLTGAISRAGGREASRIGLEKLEALAAALSEARDAGRRFSANVGGARVICDAGGRLSVGPEPARRGKDREGADLPASHPPA